MLFRKALIQEVKKTFSNVGADLLAILGVESDYLSVLVICFSLFFCALYFRFTFLCPLPFKAFSYSGLAELKTCSLEELLDNRSSIESGRCFII